jgi:mxaA protein
MKNPIFKCFIYFILVSIPQLVCAQSQDAATIKLTNPSHSVGIRIGDVLHRRILLTVNQPYQISKNSFPVKGRTIKGLELAEIEVKATQSGDKNIYDIDLAYQVFHHVNTPVVMELPSEKFALTGGPKALSIDIPAWHFWFSPLVAGDISNAIANLQPQQPMPFVGIANHKNALVIFLLLFVAGLIGMIYINADKRWLPFMGGAFARAHRQLKHLPKTRDEERKALFYLHQAFNQVNGANLFAQDIDGFLRHHPSFAKLKADIQLFFDSSNKSLFADQRHDSAAFMQGLVAFSRQLRDCERGI